MLLNSKSNRFPNEKSYPTPDYCYTDDSSADVKSYNSKADKRAYPWSDSPADSKPNSPADTITDSRSIQSGI